MSKIDSLFTGVNKAYPIHKRYPKKLTDAYIRDLKKVIKMVEDGQSMPTRRGMKDYFLDEYGMDIGENATHRHINLLKKGQHPWQ